jgi:hypothetical protein
MEHQSKKRIIHELTAILISTPFSTEHEHSVLSGLWSAYWRSGQA